MAKTFDQRVVAFVDILGFRNIVARMNKEPHLFATVRDALKTINSQAQQFRQYQTATGLARKVVLRGGAAPLVQPTHFEMTAFSDCYVLSEKTATWRVLAAVQALGSNLLGQGILSRGGVVRGSAYHRGPVVFGQAVIDAYELESNVAKYPRILVSETVRKATWGYHLGVCQGRLYLRDIDGCWFVNVLAPPLSRWKALSDVRVTMDSATFLTSVGAWLRKELQLSQGDLRRSSKLLWLAHHFNTAAAQEERIEPIQTPASTE
jgi:hypothetical protein